MNLLPAHTRPKLLDLFCGAGGAGWGYYLAGFDVTGVDNAPQPHYPAALRFVQADALDYVREHGHEYAAIHASPPCQFASIGAKFKGTAHRYSNFIPAARQALNATGKPYIIENVPGAATWLRNPVSLWGDLFGLRVVRVRLFESNFPLAQMLLAMRPTVPMVTTASRDSYSTFANGASHITVAGNNYRREDGALAMGIQWMTRRELSQAIPPAYTRWIGAQLMTYLRTARPVDQPGGEAVSDPRTVRDAARVV